MRSFYLDDMQVTDGDVVVCKCAIASPQFTIGRSYRVFSGKRLMDDIGQLVHPSARFRYEQ